jgi:hypothetical protein
MTIGIVLMKGRPDRLEHIYEFLAKMKEEEPKILEVFLSMGWPDMVLLIKGDQVLDIQSKINRIKYALRNREEAYKDLVDTSTIVCIEENEREQIKKEMSEYLTKSGF